MNEILNYLMETSEERFRKQIQYNSEKIEDEEDNLSDDNEDENDVDDMEDDDELEEVILFTIS